MFKWRATRGILCVIRRHHRASRAFKDHLTLLVKRIIVAKSLHLRHIISKGTVIMAFHVRTPSQRAFYRSLKCVSGLPSPRRLTSVLTMHRNVMCCIYRTFILVVKACVFRRTLITIQEIKVDDVCLILLHTCPPRYKKRTTKTFIMEGYEYFTRTTYTLPSLPSAQARSRHKLQVFQHALYTKHELLLCVGLQYIILVRLFESIA